METHHLEARPLDLVLSQHPEHETTLSDLQGRRCCSWPAIASHLTIIGLVVVEKVLSVIEVSLSRRRRSAKPGRRRGAKRFCEVYRRGVAMATRENSFGLRRQKSVLPERQLWGPWICKSWEIWFKATGLTFYIPVQGATNSSHDPTVFPPNVRFMRRASQITAKLQSNVCLIQCSFF